MEKMKLRGVTLMGGEMLHAKLAADIQDDNVSHSLEAVVVLGYSEGVMGLTLEQIQTDARNRLSLGERLSQ